MYSKPDVEPQQGTASEDPATDAVLVVEDLIEEVSIDGMCGVY